MFENLVCEYSDDVCRRMFLSESSTATGSNFSVIIYTAFLFIFFHQFGCFPKELFILCNFFKYMLKIFKLSDHQYVIGKIINGLKYFAIVPKISD